MVEHEENAFEDVAESRVPALAAQQQIAPVGALAATDQSRAVAEVQAALVIAASRPRNELSARERIIQACQRVSLAEGAIYQYTRGGAKVSGPSIRLAEACARSWGNMTYGFRELGRANGVSEVEAFAWDLETNTKAVRQFSVKHWRDTRDGGYPIKDERDIYEMVANSAQRRVRACILEIVPGDIMEDAVAQCERTCHEAIKNKGKDIAKTITDMVAAFSKLGVTRQEIEVRLGHRVDACQPAEVLGLSKIYTSMKDGFGTKEDYFKPAADAPQQDPQARPAQTGGKTSSVTDKLRQKREAATKPQSASPAPGQGEGASAPENDAQDGPGEEPGGNASDSQGAFVPLTPEELDAKILPMPLDKALEFAKAELLAAGYTIEDGTAIVGCDERQWTKAKCRQIVEVAQKRQAELDKEGM